MTRPPKINEAQLIERLLTGITDTKAKDEFDVSREAIRLRRKDLEKRGLLPPRGELVIVKRGGRGIPIKRIAPSPPRRKRGMRTLVLVPSLIVILARTLLTNWRERLYGLYLKCRLIIND